MMDGVSELAPPKRVLIGALIAAAAAFGLLASLGTTPASAQLAPICEQYPSLPECQDQSPDVGGDEVPPGQPGAGGGPGAGATGAVTPGTLPFTGYPITALLLLMLVLLLAGLTLRGYLAIRNRIRATRTPPPGNAA